jgi:hypothetical protein
MRRHVVEALGLKEGEGGIIAICEDPQRLDTLYVVSTKEARIDAMHRSTQLNGGLTEKDGNMRAYIKGERNTIPVCPKCHTPHWQYQMCT